MDITKFLSVYAAILSSAVFIWNVRKASSRIRVKLILGMDEVEDNFVHGVSVAIQNPSSHTVHISNISLLYPYMRVTPWSRFAHLWLYKQWPRRVVWVHTSLSNYDIDDGCPVSLEPGTSHHVLVPENILEKILKSATERKVVAVVQDALWRNKYSTQFDCSEFKM